MSWRRSTALGWRPLLLRDRAGAWLSAARLPAPPPTGAPVAARAASAAAARAPRRAAGAGRPARAADAGRGAIRPRRHHQRGRAAPRRAHGRAPARPRGDPDARGAYSLKARTIRRASTLPSHAAMLSGFDVERARPVLELVAARARLHPGADDLRRRRTDRQAARPRSSASASSSTSPTPARSTCSRAPATSARRSSTRRPRYFVEKQPADRVRPLLRSRRPRPLRRLDVGPAARGRSATPTAAWARCSTPSRAAGLDARRCSSSRPTTAATATTTRARIERTA